MDPLAGKTPALAALTSLRCQNPKRCGEPLGRSYLPALHCQVLLSCPKCGGDSMFRTEANGLMCYFMGVPEPNKAAGLVRRP